MEVQVTSIVMQPTMETELGGGAGLRKGMRTVR